MKKTDGTVWVSMPNPGTIPIASIPLHRETSFRDAVEGLFSAGSRPVAFFPLPPVAEGSEGFEAVQPGQGPKGRTVILAVFADDQTGQSRLLSLDLEGKRKYGSLTLVHPALHMFERELFEETGIEPTGHPWLKPVRYPVSSKKRNAPMEQHPFFSMTGAEAHEVAVGPVHAGVIEPGHFRFLCFGERVYHLEIQLGFQHRAVESLLTSSGIGAKTVRIAESIAGDTVIGHSWACASILESLSGTRVSPRASKIRALALELERAAIHVGDLGALANDIAYMMGASVFGAIRTLIINSSLAICGSRFGRGLMRFGGVNFDPTPALASKIADTLAKCASDIDLMARTMLDTPGVLSRFEKTGTVSREDAERINLVGPAGRGCGLRVDVRSTHPVYPYGAELIPSRPPFQEGDVMSRAAIRHFEIMESLDFCQRLLADLRSGNGESASGAGEVAKPSDRVSVPDSVALSMIEGWRGEIAHCAVTGRDGTIRRYKIKDPSFNNWFGLALAVRGNGISDFPLCNKSFNLSYCGHDL